jgi:hypothetical protein
LKVESKRARYGALFSAEARDLLYRESQQRFNGRRSVTPAV